MKGNWYEMLQLTCRVCYKTLDRMMIMIMKIWQWNKRAYIYLFSFSSMQIWNGSIWCLNTARHQNFLLCLWSTDKSKYTWEKQQWHCFPFLINYAFDKSIKFLLLTYLMFYLLNSQKYIEIRKFHFSSYSSEVCLNVYSFVLFAG